jgi:hypothetical protein
LEKMNAQKDEFDPESKPLIGDGQNEGSLKM